MQKDRQCFIHMDASVGVSLSSPDRENFYKQDFRVIIADEEEQTHAEIHDVAD